MESQIYLSGFWQCSVDMRKLVNFWSLYQSFSCWIFIVYVSDTMVSEDFRRAKCRNENWSTPPPIYPSWLKVSFPLSYVNVIAYFNISLNHRSTVVRSDAQWYVINSHNAPRTNLKSSSTEEPWTNNIAMCMTHSEPKLITGFLRTFQNWKERVNKVNILRIYNRVIRWCYGPCQ